MDLHGTAWSLVPFLIVIPLSVLTRQVLPGLAVGLIAGAYMMHPTLLGGVTGSIHYILAELVVPDNLRLIVFLYGFGAFVGLVRVTGGVTGFAEWMVARVKSERGAFAWTWMSSFATFMAPDFRIITVAPVMKRVFERLKVPPTQVALAIEITSTPLCAIVPIGTAFVGYMVGLIATSGRHQALAGSPYHIFLLSIPLNFFALAMLAFGLIATFFLRHRTAQAQPSLKRLNLVTAESRLKLASQFPAVETAKELTPPPDRSGNADAQSERQDDYPDPVEVVSERIAPNAWNLTLPLLSLLALTLFLTWWDGHLQAATFGGALTKANAAKAMLEALFITLVLSVVWYIIQRQPIQRTMFGFLAGGNEMMGVIVLLALVWSVSAVSTDLGFVAFTERTIGRLVPPAFIAPVLFVFGCAISYVIGSSFGTWGMLLPLGFSLAASAHASLPLVAGAVFASGTFGGFASPLSDNTVAMATVLKLPLMQYARLKLRNSLPVASFCAVLYAVVGWLFPAIA